MNPTFKKVRHHVEEANALAFWEPQRYDWVEDLDYLVQNLEEAEKHITLAKAEIVRLQESDR